MDEREAEFVAKHNLVVDADGKYNIAEVAGKAPRELEVLLEQIKTNLGGTHPGLEDAKYDGRTFVFVGGGPSVSKHLDEINALTKQPKEYLVVCSNMTARWLILNGVTPHVQVILDPKEAKVNDLAGVTNDVELWLSLTCHPSVFAAAEKLGRNIKIFLACGDVEGRDLAVVRDAPQDGRTINGIQGGTMAGTRAMNLADMMGFRKMLYFGLDASVVVHGDKFQPYAYLKPRGDAVLEIDCDRCDAKFHSTTVFQHQVNEVIEWSDRMPWLEIEMRGDGLMQHYWKHIQDEREAKRRARPEGYYSQAYAEQQLAMHADTDHEYGVSGGMHAIPVFSLASQMLKRNGAVSVLDYGSSSGSLFKAIDGRFYVPHKLMQFYEYDPFVKGKDRADPADLVVCIDVLEHIEPEYIENVLDHLAALTKRVAYLSACLVPARKTLPDGRNAHILLKDVRWWLTKLRKRFVLTEIKEDGTNLYVVAESIAMHAQRSMGN